MPTISLLKPEQVELIDRILDTYVPVCDRISILESVSLVKKLMNSKDDPDLLDYIELTKKYEHAVALYQMSRKHALELEVPIKDSTDKLIVTAHLYPDFYFGEDDLCEQSNAGIYHVKENPNRDIVRDYISIDQFGKYDNGHITGTPLNIYFWGNPDDADITNILYLMAGPSKDEPILNPDVQNAIDQVYNYVHNDTNDNKEKLVELLDNLKTQLSETER